MAEKISVKTGIEEIQFGSGGGFTGEIKTFSLTEDCKLFEKGKELKKIKYKDNLKIFKEAQEIKDLTFHEPQNMYSFIEIKSTGKTNRIVWGMNSNAMDKRIVELYQKLTSIAK